MSDFNRVAKLIGPMRVAVISRLANVTPTTVRYYVRAGLLKPYRSPENGYRCFSRSDLTRLIVVRKLQALGLTIGDIKAVLEMGENGKISSGKVKSLVEERLEDIEFHVGELQTKIDLIKRAIKTWERVQDSDPCENDLHSILEQVSATLEIGGPFEGSETVAPDRACDRAAALGPRMRNRSIWVEENSNASDRGHDQKRGHGSTGHPGP